MDVAMITGGAQGIGRAIALAFGGAGYAVSVIDPAEDAGHELEAMIRNYGGRALYVAGDSSSEADAAAWFDQTEAAFGATSVLVNNSGIMVRKPFLELALADFDRVMAVNLRGAVLCAQLAGRAMVAAGRGGAIVNIASTRAFMSEPGTESYAASKGALVALTHALAVSLGPQGIRVNAIAPGWIETGDWQFSGRARAPKHSEADKGQHPVGRVGTPRDVAAACLYLVREPGFVTGQTLTVDGGMTVKMIYEE